MFTLESKTSKLQKSTVSPSAFALILSASARLTLSSTQVCSSLMKWKWKKWRHFHCFPCRDLLHTGFLFAETISTEIPSLDRILYGQTIESLGIWRMKNSYKEALRIFKGWNCASSSRILKMIMSWGSLLKRITLLWGRSGWQWRFGMI